MSRASWVGACLAAAVAGALAAGPASAQPVAAPQLKAAFVANLAQFVQWPADAVATGVPLFICVVDDWAVAQALEGMTRGKTIGGHGVTVKSVAADAALPTCNVLYLTRSSGKRSSELLATVQSSGVLTIADIPDFALVGGIIELVRENDRIGITVNLTALNRAGIRLSSSLLSLAKIVDDPADRAIPKRGGDFP